LVQHKKLLVNLNFANLKKHRLFRADGKHELFTAFERERPLGSRRNVNVTGSIELFGAQYVQQSKEDKSAL
jgi:hypothetical protein